MNAFDQLEQYTIVHVIANDAVAIDGAAEIQGV